MITSPLISVIIPVYNAAKYLPRCVKSLQAQTHPNLEIILVDDGSKDNSPQLCDEFAAQDPRVKVFHKPNGGVSSARNVGLDNARGEYIGFVDADDEIHPQMYEILLTHLTQHKADVAACQAHRIKENQKCIFPTISNIPPQILTNTETILYALSNPHYAPLQGTIWNKLFKRGIIQNTRFDTTLARAEDTQFLLFVLQQAHRAVILTAPLYAYYCNIATSAMHQLKLVNWLDECKVFNSFVKLCQKNGYSNASKCAQQLLYIRTVWVTLILLFADTQNKHTGLLNEKLAYLKKHKKQLGCLSRKQQGLAVGLTFFPTATVSVLRIPWVSRFFNRRHPFDKYDLSL